jgi:serine/threonine-protein kinase
MHDRSTGPADDTGLRRGLLAFRRGHVALDDLVAALHAWGGDPGRPLDQLLPDPGALGPATVSDATAPPGAPTPPTRAGDAAPDPLPYPAGRGDPSRYRVVGPYAEGGLGEVFMAEDTEVRRPVALKKIKPQYAASAAGRRRFLREAEITGGLEHPGVVPVYGLGAPPDGVPYYAMRLVHGETFQDAIRRFHERDSAERAGGFAGLAFRRLLRRFVDVCNAVAYAHSKNVLHRDLKPANVMLGAFGETLVIDWGMAKDLGGGGTAATGGETDATPPAPPADGETRPGAALGTPAYMSPEQAAGRLDELGPAADVFSLGATLYSLLTGRPPYQGEDAVSVLELARRGQFARPRAVNPAVPRALEAVCLKAMAARPADRYADALALAGDIEHWLADEPVAAYAEPVGARLARWGRRHRPVVTGVGAAVLVGVAALALSAARLAAANQKLEVANAAESAAKTAAQEQEARAKENFRLARESVNRYLKRVGGSQRLKDAGLAALRKELLDEAGGFYQEFIRARADDPTLEAELSQAYLQAAKIEADTGDASRAVDRFKAARDYLAKLAAAHPDALTYQTDLAGCIVTLGQVSRMVDRNDEAGEYYRDGLARLEALAAAHPGDAEVLKALAAAYKALGSLQRARADYAAAARSLDQSRTLFEQLATAHPADGDYADSLAGAWSNLGLIRRDAGDHAGAVAALQTAREVQRKLVERFPDQDDYRSFLGGIHINLGLVYESGDQFAEAEQAFVAAVPYYRTVADRHPEVAHYRGAQAMGLNELGRFYADVNKPDQALAALTEALGLWRQLVARHPDVTLFASELARCLANVGNLHYGHGRGAAALLPHQEALALREKLAANNPDVTLYATDLQNSQDDVGLVLQVLDRYGEAEAAFRAAVATNEKLVAKLPTVPNHLHHLGNCYKHLGTLHLNAGDTVQAEAAYRAGLAAREKLVALPRHTPYHAYGLADARVSLGAALSRLGRPAEAEPLLRAGAAALEDFAAKNPDVVDYVSSLGYAYNARGDHEERQQQYEPAVAWYGKAIASLTALRAKNPQAERARVFAVNAHAGRAGALTRLDRLPDALRDWDAALALAKEAARPGLRLGRAATVARGGDHAAAAAMAEQQTADPKAAAQLLVDAAGVFALAGPAALRDVALPAAERGPAAERYAARALALLGRARDLGFFAKPDGRKALDAGPDLEWLRGRADFQAFRAGLKAE